jgi:hypothetical protein
MASDSVDNVSTLCAKTSVGQAQQNKKQRNRIVIVGNIVSHTGMKPRILIFTLVENIAFSSQCRFAASTSSFSVSGA